MRYVAFKDMDVPDSCSECPVCLFGICLTAPEDSDGLCPECPEDGRPSWCQICIVDGIEIREEAT